MMHTSGFGRAAMLVTVSGLTALSALPAVAGPCQLNQIAAFPITMTEMRPLMAAKINDTEVRFMLDSGAFYSTLSTPSATELELKLQPAPFGFFVRGAGGGSADMQIATVKVFTLAGVPLHNVQFLVGGSTIGSDNVGVLGQNILHLADVEYDLGQGVVRLIKPKDCSGSLAYWSNATSTPVSVIKIDPTTIRQPQTVASAYINGKAIRVMFDSGAGLSLLSLKAAARVGITPDSPGVVAAGESHGIGRRTFFTYLAPFASFKIGDEEIRNTRLRIGDLNLPEVDMLLGPDFFLSHRLYVANGQGKLYFSYNGGPVFNLSRSKAATQAGAPDTAPPAAAASDGAASAASAGPSKSGGEGEQAADFSRRGGVAASRQDFVAALEDLTRACELAPDNAEYFLQRGMIHWRLKHGEAALADLDQALTLRADFVDALVARAELFLQRGDKAGAGRDLDAANAATSPQADVRLRMARDYGAADLPDPAVVQLDLWVAAHEEDARLPEALNSRCWIRALSGRDLPLALKDCDMALKRATKATPFYAHVLDSRGLVRLRLGDYDHSLADFDASLKINPKNAWSWYARGIDKLHKQDQSGGQADIAQATALWPAVAEAFGKRGMAP